MKEEKLNKLRNLGKEKVAYSNILNYEFWESVRVCKMFQTKEIKILKCGLYNPCILFPKGMLEFLWGERHGIEYVRSIIDNLKMTGKLETKLKIGDIRDLPYKSNSFNVILDLSTLDHIKPNETKKVLSEYNRVLKKGGKLLLFVWCDEEKDWNNEQEWKPNIQYAFNIKRLKNEINEYFKIIEEHTILEKIIFSFMKEFILEKK